MFRYATIALFVFGIALTATSEAAISVYTSRAAFDAAAGTTSSQDFNSFASDTPFNLVPLDVGPFTLSVIGSASSSNRIDVPPALFAGFSVDGTAFAAGELNGLNSVLITFDAPITSFGADFAGWNDTIRRSDLVIDGNVIMPPTTVGNQIRFFGVTSDVAFTTVEIRGVPGLGDSFGFDNVSFGASATSVVPEPAMCTMWGIGAMFVAIAAHGRKRKLACIF